mgnify:CR=1 FL=1
MRATASSTLKANKEIAVASTKSFIGQVVSLTLLALLLAQVKYRLTTKQARMLFRELSRYGRADPVDFGYPDRGRS